MPHDKNGAILKVGDRVNLTGTVIEITSDQPTFCNITLEADERMAPDAEQYRLSLSARMVEKTVAEGAQYAGDSVRESKWLRSRIDAVIQELRAASGSGQRAPGCPTRASRERSLALTKLQEALMWLGMDLKAINDESPGAAENPYPNSKDPSNTKIDPTAEGLKL